jgi:hypothetical protein
MYASLPLYERHKAFEQWQAHGRVAERLSAAKR